MHLAVIWEGNYYRHTKATWGCLDFQTRDIKPFSLPTDACHFLASSQQVSTVGRGRSKHLRLPQKTSSRFSSGSVSTSSTYLLDHIHGAQLLPDLWIMVQTHPFYIMCQQCNENLTYNLRTERLLLFEPLYLYIAFHFFLRAFVEWLRLYQTWGANGSWSPLSPWRKLSPSCSTQKLSLHLLEKPTERNNEDTMVTVCFEKMLLKFLNTIYVLSSAHSKGLRASSSFKPFHKIYSFCWLWILFIIKISKISPLTNIF